MKKIIKFFIFYLNGGNKIFFFLIKLFFILRENCKSVFFIIVSLKNHMNEYKEKNRIFSPFNLKIKE